MNTCTDSSTVAREAFSVEQFCTAHGLSRSGFYELLRQQRGPRLMRLGRRVLISREAAADWRRRMEEAASSAPTDSGSRGR